MPTSPLQPPVASSVGAARPQAAGRVLIVDDSAELVETLRAVLAAGSPRLTIETASFGEAALAAAQRGFDVAIVDVKLPDVSGVDLIEPLRRAAPLSEVILLTGFASVDFAIGALRSGAFAFVLKSFRPEELLSTVAQALGKVQLKREREELERRYRELVEVTDVLVVALDGDDRVALMNRKAASLVEVTPEQAVGRPLVESWLPEEDHAALRGALASVRAAHGALRAHEVETGFDDPAAPAASLRRIRWHLSRSPDPSGLVYGIGLDVTERRTLDKRAADVEALSAMGELAMHLAHEIRNPLNAAVLQLHLLSRHLDRLDAAEDTKVVLKDRARIVGDEIGRLNRLLTDFLELARPRGIAREPVHLPRLLDEVLDLEGENALRSGVAVVRELPADGCVALGDREKLKQVALNLVVNALEAMKQGGVLTVIVRPAGDRVVMLVEDTGAGIDAEVLGSVFDPFFTTKEAGTGLGLSIVRKIVDQHGGDVAIERREPHGARVKVSIPMGR
jgi:PAS domain S-box-containing protein